MRRRLLQWLVCPRCHVPLVVKPKRSADYGGFTNALSLGCGFAPIQVFPMRPKQRPPASVAKRSARRKPARAFARDDGPARSLERRAPDKSLVPAYDKKL